MASKSAWPILSLAALVLVQPGRGALADEAGCLVVGAWDEARGEPVPVIEAVVSTIVNRARSRGLSVCDAVMDPAALTGVTPAMHELFSEAARPHGSPTAQPHTGHDRDQLAAVEAAAAAALAGTLPDRSNGATHFYSPAGMRELGLSAAPRWAASMVETATVGPFVFLRERGLAPRSQTNIAALPPAPVRSSPPVVAVEPPAEMPTLADAPRLPDQDAEVAAASVAPVDFAPLPPASLRPLAIRRAAEPVQIASAVLDPGSTLDAERVSAPSAPRFSIVASAAAAELPAQPEPAQPPAAPSDAPLADVPPADAPAAAIGLPPAPTPTVWMPPAPTPRSAAAPARNFWIPPAAPPPRAWAPPVEPAAAFAPPRPPLVPAVGYWSPKPGALLACQGWGRRAILVAVNWRRVWRPVVTNVRCGM